MRLGVGVGVLGELELTGRVVRDPVPLRGAVDAVRPVEPGVEPLGAVGRAHLVRHHVREFVIERLCVLVAVEVAVALSPVLPAPREAVDDLPRGFFGPRADLIGGRGIEPRRRQPVLAAVLGDARLAKVLGDHDVGRELRPGLGHLRIGHLEDDRAVGVADLARPRRPVDGVERVLTILGELALDLH